MRSSAATPAAYVAALPTERQARRTAAQLARARVAPAYRPQARSWEMLPAVQKLDQIPYALVGKLAGKMTPKDWISVYESARQ